MCPGILRAVLGEPLYRGLREAGARQNLYSSCPDTRRGHSPRTIGADGEARQEAVMAALYILGCTTATATCRYYHIYVYWAFSKFYNICNQSIILYTISTIYCNIVIVKVLLWKVYDIFHDAALLLLDEIVSKIYCKVNIDTLCYDTRLLSWVVMLSAYLGWPFIQVRSLFQSIIFVRDKR